MRYITWDITILAAFGLLLSYSLLIRKHKALATLVSVYIAYVMTTVWGDPVTQFFAGDRVVMNQVWVKANTSSFAVHSAMLVLLTFLLSSFLKLGGRRSKYTAVEVVVYATCTLALAVMFIISFASPEVRTEVIAGSKIVPWIYQYRDWILVLPVFAMIFFGIYSNDD